jgi:hypothetical protein
MSTEAPSEVVVAPGITGRGLEDVVVEIDYAIIEHFSSHLYGSPNKAIEELVSNGFDAFASEVDVYIPGSLVDDRVVVWDDGDSMDVQGLHALWWIARSPKLGGDRLVQKGERSRRMIGKFGIGKLASYAVGHRIAHLCRIGEQFLLVSVDYREVPKLEDALGRPAEDRRYRTPIVELTMDQARAYAESLFRRSSRTLSQMWDRDHWTLAVIEDLKDVELTEGRLGWVIGNGMPLRPDFGVWVNDRRVEPKLSKDAAKRWNLGEPRLREEVLARWASARGRGRVSGELVVLPDGDPADNQDHTPAMLFPELGLIRAEVNLFDDSLRPDREADHGRSWGFFIMVRDRLINPEDDKLLLHEPSFGTFFRSQFIIRADGLDADILADREHVHRNTPRTRELAVLQDALYQAARLALERLDADRQQERNTERLLPVDSREFFREPLTALLLKEDKLSTWPVDPTSAPVDRVPLGEEASIAKLDADHGQFLVNETHPLLSAIRDKLGSGRVAREAFRALDLFAVSERLLEGYLYDLGISDERINRIMDWRDGLFRSMAIRFAKAPDKIVEQVVEASYVRGKPFEDALAKLFRLMGFEANRDGLSGKKDVLVVAPIGLDEYRFTVEAKGSKNAVENDQAEVAAAAAHAREAGATLGLIVAREFIGFERPRKEGPAILNECASTEPKVSIASIDVLFALYEAMRDYAYPLGVVLPLLAEIETPDEKLARVQRELGSPTDDFAYRTVLEAIWQQQQEQAARDVVVVRALWQSGPNKWGVPFPEFERRITALEALSGGLLRFSDGIREIRLLTNPQQIVERIQRDIEARRRTSR